MPNTREKLIELLKGAETKVAEMLSRPLALEEWLGVYADHLIANGVTFQKEARLYWKPVEKGVWNLTCSACDSHLGCREEAKHCPECGAKFVKYQALSPKLPEEKDDE